MKTQPTSYTEVAVANLAKVNVPIHPQMCDRCAHSEPFGNSNLIVWCSKLDGHIYLGCSCPSWQPRRGSD